MSINLFKNQTRSLCSINKILLDLAEANLNIILIGSSAAILYDLCNESQDIDFIIDTSEKNMYIFYIYLKQFFPIKNFEEFLSLDRIIIQPHGDKRLEFIKDIRNKNYDSLIKSSTKKTFYNLDISVIDIEEYINMINLCLEDPFLRPIKKEKYNNILQTYLRIKSS